MTNKSALASRGAQAKDQLIVRLNELNDTRAAKAAAVEATEATTTGSAQDDEASKSSAAKASESKTLVKQASAIAASMSRGASASAAEAGAGGGGDIDPDPCASGVEDGELATDDNDDDDDGESLVTITGTAEEWELYRESREERANVRLSALERDRSDAMVTALRTDDENDAAMAIDQKGVITNHESVETYAGHQPPLYSLPYMPRAEHWPGGRDERVLLAKARVSFRHYDSVYVPDRERRLCDSNGRPLVSPIPVVLYDGETEDEYEAAFLASFKNARVRTDRAARTIAANPASQRSQRIQFALERVRAWRQRHDMPEPVRAAPRSSRKRATADASRSPPGAPQRQRQGQARLPAGALRAPTSSARSRATSPSSASDHAGSWSPADVLRGSGARRDDPSTAQGERARAAIQSAVAARVAFDHDFALRDQRAATQVQTAQAVATRDYAVASSSAQGAAQQSLASAHPPVAAATAGIDFVSSMLSNAIRLNGVLESRLEARDREIAELRSSHAELETRVHGLRSSVDEEHALAKSFYQKYSRLVKALVSHQAVLDETLDLPPNLRFAHQA